MKIKDNNLDDILKITILNNFSGGYRLEYDGKYIILLGKDNRYELFSYSNTKEYEEMVLISCVLEIRNANPTIKEIKDKEIIINLGVEPKNELF